MLIGRIEPCRQEWFSTVLTGLMPLPRAALPIGMSWKSAILTYGEPAQRLQGELDVRDRDEPAPHDRMVT